MDLRTDCSAFRAQLVVPEHRQLFDYWIECCAGRDMPERRDIDPCRMPRLLPGISLINVEKNLLRSTFRLAGTRLREVHDREITGTSLDQQNFGDRHDYWMTAYRRTVDEALPTQGMLKGQHLHKEHLVQYWLRLPLGNGARPNMVLGHDVFVESAAQHERVMNIA